MSKEKWKSCRKIGFSLYKISNKGRLKNIKTRTILKGCTQGGYHHFAMVSDKGIKKIFLAHTIVAKIFIGFPKKGETVDHIDRIKLNNNVKNLRWATPKMQANNRTQSKQRKGRQVYQLDKDTGQIIKKWDKINDASIFLGLKKPHNISGACNNDNKTAGGFKWKYAEDYDINKKEKWKLVPKHTRFNIKNVYVSNIGRIKYNNKILNGHINNHGYKVVCIRYKQYFVHRLIAVSFIGINDDLYVNHIDGIKSNNNLKNLEYCTPSENSKHAYKLGLIKTKGISVNQYTLDSVFIKKHSSMQNAGKKIGVGRTRICAVCRGKAQTAGGFKWEYANPEKIEK